MEDLFDRVVVSIVFGAILIAIFCIVFVWTPRHLQNIDQARQWAEANKCEYIGSNRDLPDIMFFDCNGVINAKRFQPPTQ